MVVQTLEGMQREVDDIDTGLSSSQEPDNSVEAVLGWLEGQSGSFDTSGNLDSELEILMAIEGERPSSDTNRGKYNRDRPKDLNQRTVEVSDGVRQENNVLVVARMDLSETMVETDVYPRRDESEIRENS